MACAVGVSALGDLLAHHARPEVTSGLAAIGVDAARLGGGGASQVPDVHGLPAQLAQVIEHGYGTGVGEIFLLAAPLGVVAFLAVLAMREVPLGSKSGIELQAEG